MPMGYVRGGDLSQMLYSNTDHTWFAPICYLLIFRALV